MDISPYGQKAGLKARMQEWAIVLRENKAYVGLIVDVELVVANLPDDVSAVPSTPLFDL